MVLNNLANLHSDKHEFTQAEKAYGQALEVYQKLAEANPQTYMPYVAMTQINMSIFYQESVPNKDRSLKLVNQAILNLEGFKHIPYIQDYLKEAFDVLKAWGVEQQESNKEE